MSTAALAAYFSYRDAAAAIRWYESVGFAVIARHDGAQGEVVHAELRLADVVVMLSSFDDD